MMSASTLCSCCSAIDYMSPCAQPQFQQNGAAIATHLSYSHHNSIDELTACAKSSACQLCVLILSVIEEHDSGELTEEDWEHVDVLWNEATTESLEALASIPKHIQELCAAMNVPGDGKHGPEPAEANVDRSETTIVLEIIFRDPIQLEPKHRCTDIKIHWTTICGSRDSLLCCCLVSSLPETTVNFLEQRTFGTYKSTGSATALDLARFWLRICDSTHETCRQRRGSHAPRLPTRVIDISNPDDKPRLHISSSCERGEYVALSHCWGKLVQFKTESGSLASRCAGIDLELMPQTFRDAIQAARHLGFPYIWIDSLCIIQDSADDWQKEARVMGRYYREASLSIFALSSRGDEEGCFCTRDGDRTALRRTPMFDELVGSILQTPKSPTFIQRLSTHKCPYMMGDVLHGFENIAKVEARHVLQWRGWTLQEWVLSTRALGFSDQEVSWVCPTMSACECLPEGSPDVTQSMVGSSCSGPLKPVKRRLNATSDVLLTDMWYKVVMEFSRRSLTYTDDKLPALAGMAGEFSTAKVGAYVAGLWNDGNLRYQLAWLVFPIWKATRPLGYRSPTWSWASVDGEVQTVALTGAEAAVSELDRRGVALQCEVMQCSTVPVTSLNPLGSVASGSLTLRGRFRRANVQPNNGSSKFEKVLIVCDEENGTELGVLYRDDTILAPTFKHVWCMPLAHIDSGLRCLGLIEAETEEVDRAAQHGNLCPRVFKRIAIVLPNFEVFRRSGRVVHNWTEEAGSVTYERNLSLSTVESFVAWLEQASEEEISVI